MMDPSLHSPTGDSFRSSAGSVKVSTPKRSSVVIDFPAPVASLERLLDQVVIQSSKASPRRALFSDHSWCLSTSLVNSSS